MRRSPLTHFRIHLAPLGLLAALALFPVLHVHAASSAAETSGQGCGPEVRLDSRGGTMEHVPVVDQGDFGICYAAAASEMTDAYRLSHGKMHSQSSMFEGAVGSGIKQGESVKSALDDGGDACDVADYYQKAGSCKEKVFSGGSGSIREDVAFLAKSYDLQDGADDSDSCGSDSKAKKPKTLTEKIQDMLAHQSCTEQEALSAQAAKTDAEMKKVLISISNRVGRDMARELEQACLTQGRQKVSFSSCVQSRGHFPKTPQATQELIETYLSSNRAQPFGISYCSNVLTAGAKYIGIKPDGDEKCDCDAHASVIIGKRTNRKTQKCQFLIQNSWGTDCDSYSNDWQCKEGKIWIDADALSRNSDDYSYLR